MSTFRIRLATVTIGVVGLLIASLLNAVGFADPTYTLSGTLYDGDNQPMAGVQLLVNNAVDGDVSVATDTYGHYSVELAPGSYGVYALDQSSSETAVAPSNLTLRNTDYPLDLSAGNVAQDLKLNTVSVAVTIKDVNGDPVGAGWQAYAGSNGGGSTTFLDGNSSVAYSVRDDNGDETSDIGVTNSSGIATLTLLKGLTYKVCATTNSNYQVCNPVTVTPSSDTDAEVDLPTLHTISGTFYDGSNNPIPNSQVFLSNDAIGDLSIHTDGSGYYSADVPSGEYNMNLLSWFRPWGFDAPNSVEIRNTSDPVDATTGDATQDVKLDTAPITVTVKDADNNVVSGIPVYISSTGAGTTTFLSGSSAAYTAENVSSQNNTDGSGQVQLTVLKGLTYEVCAQNPDDDSQVCSPTSITPTGAQSVEVDLP